MPSNHLVSVEEHVLDDLVEGLRAVHGSHLQAAVAVLVVRKVAVIQQVILLVPTPVGAARVVVIVIVVVVAVLSTPVETLCTCIR